MAVVAATITASIAFSSIHCRRPSLFLSNPNISPRRTLCLTRSSSSPEFDISFGTSAPSKNDVIAKPEAMLIPWIVRDENGNLSLSSTPPANFLQSMVEVKKKKSNITKGGSTYSPPSPPPPSTAKTPPKYSKAARRFYNTTFREPQRLSKILAQAGVASRRNSEELIFQGKVTLNGSVCKLPQTRVDILKDSIYVNGNRLPKKLPPKIYFALNKPKGYICSNGKEELKSVVSLFDDDFWNTWAKINPGLPKPRLFTVGRLDVATTGLIIVTNDGDFAQEISHPSSNLTKEYIATIEGSVHKRHLLVVSEGTEIEGVHCTPASVELLPSQPEMLRSRIRIVVNEGRNHEVRELLKNAGLEVFSLKRVRIGGFRLPSNLGLGKYVELKSSDLKVFGKKNL